VLPFSHYAGCEKGRHAAPEKLRHDAARRVRSQVTPLRGVQNSDTPQRGVSSVIAFGGCCVIRTCERPQGTRKFAQATHAPRETANPAAACSPITEAVTIALIVRVACSIPGASSIDAITSERLVVAPVGRSVGGPTEAHILGKRPAPTNSGTRETVFSSVRGGTRRDAVVWACDHVKYVR
jgi:hypothetical protein